MKEIIPNEEFLTKNYNKILNFIKTIVPDDSPRKEKLLKLFEDLGDRYASTPASPRRDYYSAFPGGLCYHTLHILQWIGRFSSTMSMEVSQESLLVVSLLFDLGKVGSETEDYYVEFSDDWHIKNGIYYETNKKIDFMRVPHRSLYWAQKYGIDLTNEEYLAIMLAEGQHDEANISYRYKESDLAIALQYANFWSRKLEKNIIVHWPS